ncbi:exo-alpha-sialidase [Mycoplasma sp. CB776]
MKKSAKKTILILALLGTTLTSASLSTYFFVTSKQSKNDNKDHKNDLSNLNNFHFNTNENSKKDVVDKKDNSTQNENKENVKFFNFSILKKDENLLMLSMNFSGFKTISTKKFKLKLLDNNKIEQTVDSFTINEQTKTLSFYMKNLTKNRNFDVQSVVIEENENKEIINIKGISITSQPSLTQINFKNSKISNLSENSAILNFELDSKDGIMIDDNKQLELKFSYKQNNLRNYIIYKGTLNKIQGKTFIKVNLNNLSSGQTYYLEDIKFVKKPEELFKNINNNFDNNIYNLHSNNPSNILFKFKTYSDTHFKSNAKFDLKISSKLNANPFENENSELTYVLNGVVLDTRKIELSKINDSIKLKFTKNNNGQNEEIYASDLEYDEDNNSLSFKIQNSQKGEDYVLEDVSIKNKGESSFQTLNIDSVNREFNVEFPLSKTLEPDLVNSSAWEKSQYKDYVFVDLKLKNNWNNQKITNLLNDLFSNNFDQQKSKSIKNALVNLIENNYEKLIDNYGIKIDNKAVILRLSISDKSNFYTEDNGIFYFVLNNTALVLKNTSDIDEKFEIANKNNSKNIIVLKNPYISHNIKGKVIENEHFKLKRLSSETLFKHNEDHSHSYRIPSVIKLANGDLVSSADKRIESERDYNNSISQVVKISKDNGKTWSQNYDVVKIVVPKRNNGGIAIDGIISEIKYLDTTSNSYKHKLQLIFDVFPGKDTSVVNLKRGNPWFYVGNNAYLKLWTKLNDPNSFDSRVSVLKEVDGRKNWFRRYILPAGVGFNSSFTERTVLEETNTYVDLSYHSDTRTITGSVYENVQETDFDNPEILNSKKTIHSVLDEPYKSGAVRPEYAIYALALNSHVASLESFDGGQTWTNLTWMDEKFSSSRNEHPFVGTGVGNGIQLHHQQNSNLNGRVIIPMYSLSDMFLLYSDDNGQTWNEISKPTGFKANLSESSLIEANDGAIYWFLRNAGGWSTDRNKFYVSKSIDGGLTWSSPDGNSLAKGKDIVIDQNYDGNVFSGISYFNWKNKDYFLFALPKTVARRNGALFIANSNFDQITELFKYDDEQKEHFAYNYPLVVNQTNDYIDFISLYESSQIFKIFNGGFDGAREQGEEIQIDRFRLWIK